jgi:hypothetical protein
MTDGSGLRIPHDIGSRLDAVRCGSRSARSKGCPGWRLSTAEAVRLSLLRRTRRCARLYPGLTASDLLHRSASVSHLRLPLEVGPGSATLHSAAQGRVFAGDNGMSPSESARLCVRPRRIRGVETV